jgi:hypothetical protein
MYPVIKTKKSLLILFAACLFNQLTQAKYSGGTGEPNNPYKIATAEDLIALGNEPNDYSKHFILTTDIDLDPNLPGRKIFDKAVVAPFTESSGGGRGGQGSTGISFTGVFDGNDHIISHLKIRGNGPAGLFGLLGGSAVVQDVGLEDVNIVSGSYTGGLVGKNMGTVTNCYSKGTVGGGSYSSYVGGLAGYNEDYGTITQCYSTGTVGAGSYVGGLVGWNRGYLTLCCSIDTVVGSGTNIGGLVGRNGYISSGSMMTNCYSTGTVYSWGSYVGGLVGYNDYSTVTNCYSAGAVISGGSSYIGGFLGYDYNGGRSVVNCFWDVQTSGKTTSAGGTGKTTAEMNDPNTFKNAGWDFLGEKNDGLNEIWNISEGGGYPTLAMFSGYNYPKLQGDGTSKNPYLISDANELGAIIYYSYYNSKSHYRLSAPIDLSGIKWRKAVIPYFAGTFDGNNYTISHLTIEGDGGLGLFGHLYYSADVNNLGVEDVNIVGPQDGLSGGSIGGLAGYSEGTVTNCYSTGSVNGNYTVGGLLGSIHTSISSHIANVTQCYSTAIVTGNRWVGGLAGGNSGKVYGCYSSGAVIGGDYVGGLLGTYDSGYSSTVSNCYCTSNVIGVNYVGGLIGSSDYYVEYCYSTGIVIGSGNYVGGLTGEGNVNWPGFWDIETSGLSTSAGGIGRTTAQMKTRSTFSNARWQFLYGYGNIPILGESWWIREGLDYPRLWWELPPDMASNPAPKDGETIYSINNYCTLKWTPGFEGALHNVYMGTDVNTINLSDVNNTNGILVSQNQTDPNLYIGPIEPNKTYYWRIDEVNEGRIITGLVWRFTTLKTSGGGGGKGRGCFTDKTGVWIDGKIVPFSSVDKEQLVSCIDGLNRIEEVQIHEGSFVCYDVLFENGNCIIVAENHYFMVENGQWISLKNLNAGAKLKSAKGLIAIKSITKKLKPYIGKVYNLKVKDSDYYLVGEDKIIARDF